MLWNTIYMQAALEHLKQQGEDVKEEDEARLSPLSHKHGNMLGHYSFTLTETQAAEATIWVGRMDLAYVFIPLDFTPQVVFIFF